MTCLDNSPNTCIVLVEQREQGRRAGEFTTIQSTGRGILKLVLLRSVTLVGETDRKMLKAAIKHSAGEDRVRHRMIPPDTIAKYAEKLESLKDEIVEIMKEEKDEKLVRRDDVFGSALLIDF
jgi:hypothetical protein